MNGSGSHPKHENASLLTCLNIPAIAPAQRDASKNTYVFFCESAILMSG
jgi:hypothetical protein